MNFSWRYIPFQNKMMKNRKKKKKYTRAKWMNMDNFMTPEILCRWQLPSLVPCRSAHRFTHKLVMGRTCTHLKHPMSSDHSSDPRRKQTWHHLNHWPWRGSLLAIQAGILCKSHWDIIAIQNCFCYRYGVPCWRCCCGIACYSRNLSVVLAEFLNDLRQTNPARIHKNFRWIMS